MFYLCCPFEIAHWKVRCMSFEAWVVSERTMRQICHTFGRCTNPEDDEGTSNVVYDKNWTTGYGHERKQDLTTNLWIEHWKEYRDAARFILVVVGAISRVVGIRIGWVYFDNLRYSKGYLSISSVYKIMKMRKASAIDNMWFDSVLFHRNGQREGRWRSSVVDNPLRADVVGFCWISNMMMCNILHESPAEKSVQLTLSGLYIISLRERPDLSHIVGSNSSVADFIGPGSEKDQTSSTVTVHVLYYQ